MSSECISSRAGNVRVALGAAVSVSDEEQMKDSIQSSAGSLHKDE